MFILIKLYAMYEKIWIEFVEFNNIKNILIWSKVCVTHLMIIIEFNFIVQFLGSRSRAVNESRVTHCPSDTKTCLANWNK